MKKSKQKIGITNINQDTGVRIEQLYEYALIMQPIMAKYMLYSDDDDYSVCAANASMLIHKKMEENKVDRFDFQKFKGYFFVTLKNEVIKMNMQNQKQRNTIVNTDFENNENDKMQLIYDDGYQEPSQAQYDYVNNILNKMPEFIKQNIQNVKDYENGKIFERKQVLKLSRISALKTAILNEMGRKKWAEDFVKKINKIMLSVTYTLDERINKLYKIGATSILIKYLTNYKSTSKNRTCITHTKYMVNKYLIQNYSHQIIKFDYANNDISSLNVVHALILIYRYNGYSYSQIKKEIRCSKSTINYYLSPDGKTKTQKRTQRNRQLKKQNKGI